MSRYLTVISCCALLLVPAASAARIGDGGGATKSGAASKPSWAQAQIRYVIQHGLMAKTVASFRADDPLTQGELATLVGGLTKRPAAAVANKAAPVTVTQLDARLVRTLGLADAAAALGANARAAGLAIPSRFGTETVARLLGLRTNHPAAQDDLELLPLGGQRRRGHHPEQERSDGEYANHGEVSG